MGTHRAEVHETGEGDNPAVHGMDHVAAIELKGWILDTQAGQHNIKQRTDQKAISQPITHHVRNMGTILTALR